jgi:predicted CopG family antitoxin
MPPAGYKTITIPEYVYQRLKLIMLRNSLASISDAISYLIDTYEGIRQGPKVVAPTFNVDANNEYLKDYIKEVRRKLGLDK